MAKTSRGVDRVPKKLQVRRPAPTYLINHGGPVKGLRGMFVKPPALTAYINPERDKKSLKAGRLRKELQP